MAMLIRNTIIITTAVAPCSSSRHLQVSSFGPSCLRTNRRDRCHFLGNRNFLQSILKVQNGTKIKMDVVVNGAEPGTPLPSDPSSGTSWKLWLVGILISVVVPFWKNKWWPLQKFREQIETTLDSVEDVAELVEKVAGEVEKVEDVEKEVDSIIDQANEKIKTSDDTEKETAKIKDATDIKNKITEIKEANNIKKGDN
ncbi:hypothetical protein PRUPE_1G524300 [Prunus persica]|uniref:Uncharacterized protein n=1 Tax=Prunus persica TaxID=3760 RepID=A0A251RGX8_PRUPE|nr:hypothetical protein PRUPE_1G524300 [Prunus persica]